MKITNNQGLPLAIFNACDPNKHNAENTLSATTLLHGTKDIILTNRHWDEMEDDCSNRIYALLGTAAHSIFENEEDKPSVIKENQFSVKVGNKYTVTGRIDRYDTETGEIGDYKTTSVYKVMSESYEEWYKQLMIYAWLLKQNGHNPKKAVIYAILRDWSKLEAKRKAGQGYPANQTKVITFDITDKDMGFIEDFIRTKVKEVEECELLPDNEIPACTAKERWEKPAKFAVMKEGRKTAVKLFDTEDEANTFLTSITKEKDKHYIEQRKSASPRCAEYCGCCKYCNFYKENVEVLIEESA